jgi:hypothetical protein
MQLLHSEVERQPGNLDDIAITDRDELLVLLQSGSSGHSLPVYRCDPSFELLALMSGGRAIFQGNPLDANRGRAVFKGPQLSQVDTDAHTSTYLVLTPAVPNVGGGSALDLLDTGQALIWHSPLTPTLSLYDPNGMQRWSHVYEEAAGGEAAFGLIEPAVQLQSSGRILASSSRQLWGHCEK